MKSTTAYDDQFASEPIQELEQKHHDKIVGIIAEKIEAERRPAPHGWKLVPVEPTSEMRVAGKNTIKGADTTFEGILAELAYRSMIDAAPTPPAQASGQSAALFRKKPVTIEAIQWTGRNLKEVIDFTGKHPRWHEWFSTWEDYERHVQQDGQRFKIFTLGGTMIAEPGDWIIRGVKGEHYPCKPDIFAATYEQAGWAPAAATVPVAAQALAAGGDAERVRNAAEILDTLTSNLVAGHPLRVKAAEGAKRAVADLYGVADQIDAAMRKEGRGDE